MYEIRSRNNEILSRNDALVSRKYKNDISYIWDIK